jgi:hypothetical protein
MEQIRFPPLRFPKKEKTMTKGKASNVKKTNQNRA